MSGSGVTRQIVALGGGGKAYRVAAREGEPEEKALAVERLPVGR